MTHNADDVHIVLATSRLQFCEQVGSVLRILSQPLINNHWEKHATSHLRMRGKVHWCRLVADMYIKILSCGPIICIEYCDLRRKRLIINRGQSLLVWWCVCAVCTSRKTNKQKILHLYDYYISAFL